MAIRMRMGIRDKLVLLAALAAVTASPLSARRMTVAQLQQLIDDSQAGQRTDDFVLRKLAGVKLTERLTPSTLQNMAAESPGSRTAQALHFLADASVFLDPPANETPPLAALDGTAQKAVIQKSIHYVARMLPTLPNFVATRITQQLVDSPQGLDLTQSEVVGGLYLVNTFLASVAYENGKETEEPFPLAAQTDSRKKGGSLKAAIARVPTGPPIGLTTNGEFGPLLASILLDVAKGKLSWGRWEQIGGKPAAVFQFAVDRSLSHFNVNVWQSPETEVVGSRQEMRGGPRGAPGTPMSMFDIDTAHAVSHLAGYHGQLAVDPDSGTILRIAIEADPPRGEEWKQAAIMVEYGPVKIGENIYMCPTHSVAVSTTKEPNQMISTIAFQSPELHVNHVEFTGYRRFGSESALITTPPLSGEQTMPPEQQQQQAQTKSPESPAAETASAAPPSRAIPGDETAVATKTTELAAAVPADPSPVTPVAPAANVTNVLIGSIDAADEEILVRAADGLAGAIATSTDAASQSVQSIQGVPRSEEGGNFTLSVTTRLVDLGLVATNKHGKPITDLKQDEIEVYDNGRKQQLVDFHHAVPGAPMATAKSQATPLATFTDAAPATADAPDLLILLLDENGLAYSDLNRARGEVLHFLKDSRPASRIALYSIGRHGFRVIQDVTQDHALVTTSLAAWTPSAPAMPQGQDSQQRNRQQFDAVQSTADLNRVSASPPDTSDSLQSADPVLRQLGANPLHAVLECMIALARHLAPISGNKSMVWISGDRAMTGPEGQTVGSENFETALLRTAEVLNEAHIGLYAVDASADDGGAVNALRASREEMNPNISESSGGPTTGPPAGGGGGAGGGRARTETPLPVRSILGSVRLLTDSTGGRAVGKGGDLESTLDGIVQDSAFVYQLGFHPDSPADGKFHTLQVRIPDRKDIKLRYRIGYLFNETSATTQQRFQQAVWSPQDASAIALTAEVVPAGDSASDSAKVKLRIAFSGLAFEQKAGHSEDAAGDADHPDRVKRWTDQLYIFIAQRDDASQQAEIFGEAMRLSLKQATYDSGMPAGIPYQRDVEAKTRLGSVRIIVVDGNSGKMGSVTLPSSALHQ